MVRNFKVYLLGIFNTKQNKFNKSNFYKHEKLNSTKGMPNDVFPESEKP